VAVGVAFGLGVHPACYHLVTLKYMGFLDSTKDENEHGLTGRRRRDPAAASGEMGGLNLLIG